MVAEDAFTCINTDAEVGIVSLDGSTLTPAGLKVAGCTLLSVKDGAANGMLFRYLNIPFYSYSW